MTADVTLLALAPTSNDELESWVVPSRERVMRPSTRARPKDGAIVNLDMRLNGRRVLVAARTSYTVPERRGPFFTCSDRSWQAIGYLFAGALRPRNQVRFLLDSEVRVGETPARLLDLSCSAARVTLPSPLVSDAPVHLGLAAVSASLPAVMTGRVVMHRRDGVI
jgi:hypothetical protein